MSDPDPFARLDRELADKAQLERRAAVVSEAKALGLDVEAIGRRAIKGYKQVKRMAGNRPLIDHGFLTEADAVLRAIEVEIAKRKPQSN